MIERKNVASLALLAALVAMAVGAQSAAASFEPARSITAFTCAKNVGDEEFTDSHCDNRVGAFEGKFGHEEIPSGVTTEIEVSNEAVPVNENETPVVRI